MAGATTYSSTAESKPAAKGLSSHADPASHSESAARLSLWQFTLRAMVVAGLFAATLLFTALVFYAGRVLLLGLAGVIFGLFLVTTSRFFVQRTGLSYRLAWGLLVVGLVLVGGVGWWAGAAQVWSQLGQMTESLPQSIEEIRELVAKDRWGKWLMSNTDFVTGVIERVGTFSRTAGMANMLLDALVDVFVVVFVGLYISAEPHFYRRGMLHLLPIDRRKRAKQVLAALGYNIQWWLYGRMIAMLVIGVLTACGLLALGVPLALTLAAIAGLLQIIPTLGPVLAAIPALLIAWNEGTQMILYVLGLYLLVQFLETYVITPLIQRKAVRLPPALVLLTMITLGITGGILGLLVAAPLTVILVVLIKMLYVQDVLRDSTIEVPGEAQFREG